MPDQTPGVPGTSPITASSTELSTFETGSSPATRARRVGVRNLPGNAPGLAQLRAAIG